MSDVIGKGKYSGKILMTQEWLDYMKETEDFHAEAYKTIETAKYYTIGYGFEHVREGSSFDEWNENAEDRVKEGATITREIADEYILFLIEYICYDGIAENFENIIDKLNKYQLSSLIDIAYNCGRGALIKSNIMKLVKENPDDPQIGVEIEKFQISSKFPGLAVRRKICAEYYFRGKINRNAVPTVKYQTDSINEVKYSSTNDCNVNNCIIDDNGGNNDGDNSNNVNQESYDYYVGLQKQANEDGRPCNIRMINELHKLNFIKFTGFLNFGVGNTFTCSIMVEWDGGLHKIGSIIVTFDEDMYKSTNLKVSICQDDKGIKTQPRIGFSQHIPKVYSDEISSIYNKKYNYTNDLTIDDITYFEDNFMINFFQNYDKIHKGRQWIGTTNIHYCHQKKKLNDKQFDNIKNTMISNKDEFIIISDNCTLDNDDLNIGNSDILITRMVNDKGNNIFNVFKTKGVIGKWTSVNRLKGSSYRKG